MKPEQVSKVPFASEMDAHYVEGDDDKYLVKRVSGLNNGLCPGEHLHQIMNNENDMDTVLEACKSYEIFQACQHTFTCECADYSKGHDCKHILLGKQMETFSCF